MQQRPAGSVSGFIRDIFRKKACNTDASTPGTRLQRFKLWVVTHRKHPEKKGTIAGESSLYQWMINVKNNGSMARKEKLETFLETSAHDPRTQDYEGQFSPSERTRAQSKASPSKSSLFSTTTHLVASPTHMTPAQSRMLASPKTPQAPQQNLTTQVSLSNSVISTTTHLVTSPRHMTRAQSRLLASPKTPRSPQEIKQANVSPKRLSRSQSKPSTPGRSSPPTPNEQLQPPPPPTASKKEARRVGADLEQDDVFQKSYAKWKRIAQHALMPNYCCARTWRGVQCSSQREKNQDFCKQHQGCLNRKKELPYGRFDQPIHGDVLHLRLYRAAVCDKKDSFKYYSRDKMWGDAKKFQHINAVEELEEDEFMECLPDVNEYFAKNQKQRDNDGIFPHMGRQSFADRENPVRMLYAGSTLRRFPYYAPSVCVAYLKSHAGRSITLHEATEQQFMDALASTSNRMKNWDRNVSRIALIRTVVISIVSLAMPEEFSMAYMLGDVWICCNAHIARNGDV